MAEREVDAGLGLLEVDVLDVRAEQRAAQAPLRAEQVRVEQGQVVAAVARAVVDHRVDAVAPPEQVGLGHGGGEDQAVLRREADAEGQRTRRALHHLDVEVELLLIVGGVGFELDVLEEAQALDAVAAAVHRARRVELALDYPHLAAHHRVARLRVPGDVDLADEVQLALLHFEGHVDGLVFLELGARAHARVEEAAVGVVALQVLDVRGEARAVEDLALFEADPLAQRREVDRRVARHVHLADVVLLALRDLDAHHQRVLAFVVLDHGDVGIAHLDLQVPVVHVHLGHLLQVLDEQGLGVGAALVDVLGDDRVPAAPLGLDAVLELLGVEVLVPAELDRVERQLRALDDLEVDRHRVPGDLLDLVGHARQVVALSAVQALDPLAVLEEQRVVEGRPGGERQRVADLVALDGFVARDRDLADDGVLLDLEGEHPPRRGRLRQHPHVAEEAEGVYLAHVRRDGRRVERLTRLGRDARLDRVGFDALVAAHADLGHHVLRRLERGLRDQPLLRHQVVDHDHAEVGPQGLDVCGGDARHLVQGM